MKPFIEGASFNFMREMSMTLAAALFARLLAAVGNFSFFVAIGKLFGADGIGVFTIAQSVLIGSSILSRQGMDNTLMCYVGKHHTSTVIRFYFKWAAIRLLRNGIVCSLVVFLSANILTVFFDAPALKNIIFGVAISVVPYSLCLLVAGFMKGVSKPVVACLFENGGVFAVTTVALLVINEIYGLKVENTGWALACGSIMSCTLGLLLTFIIVRDEKLSDTVTVEIAALRKSSKHYFALGVGDFIQNVVGIFVLGSYLSNTQLGVFKCIERLAVLLNIVMLGINSVFPPRFSYLHSVKDVKGLKGASRLSIFLCTIFSIPIISFSLVFPETLIGIFGEEFREYRVLVQIVAVAQIINVITGPMDLLLNMTGNEELCCRIILISKLIGVIALFIAVRSFAVEGAVVAYVAVIAVQNGCLLVSVWKKLGIVMLPLWKY
tara:strand:+ start:159 stop:1466 length:1308 start_codon:yes stop_codon:yes gene_type:complete